MILSCLTKTRCFLLSRDVIGTTFPSDRDQECQTNGERLKNHFLRLVQSFKQKQHLSAVRSSSKSRLDSTVAALCEAHERKKFLDSLMPSKGTLIVVPFVLLDHWRVSVIFCRFHRRGIFSGNRTQRSHTIDL